MCLLFSFVLCLIDLSLLGVIVIVLRFFYIGVFLRLFCLLFFCVDWFDCWLVA